ncbi:MAG: cation:proton antiporter subunit C [Dehalococcoidia bacterium]|jgi:multicomponent Na+:H+ antiporter subunit C|nr:cation:proton antiporter subunit C [Dehalococcoidia bacterium]
MMENLPGNFPFVAAVLLMGVALYILIFRRNLIKIVMGIAILSSSVNLFLVTLGYRAGGVAPIYTEAPEGPMVLPVVQALTLTNIVIAVATSALILSLVIRIYRHTGTLDSEKSRRMKG